MLTDTSTQETRRLLRAADRALHALSAQLADCGAGAEQMRVLSLIQALNKLSQGLDGQGALVRKVSTAKAAG